jgi:hypothetical protein
MTLNINPASAFENGTHTDACYTIMAQKGGLVCSLKHLQCLNVEVPLRSRALKSPQIPTSGTFTRLYIDTTGRTGDLIGRDML